MVSRGREPVEEGPRNSNSRAAAVWIVSRRDEYNVDEDAGRVGSRRVPCLLYLTKSLHDWPDHVSV